MPQQVEPISFRSPRWKDRSRLQGAAQITDDTVKRIARGGLLAPDEDIRDIVEWIVDAAARAPAEEETRKLLWSLLAAKEFTTQSLAGAEFGRLRTLVRARIAEICRDVDPLPPDLAEEIHDLAAGLVREDCAGRRATQSNVFGTPGILSAVLPPLESVPILMAEADPSFHASFNTAYARTLSGTISNSLSSVSMLFRANAEQAGEWAEEEWDFGHPVKLHEYLYLHTILHVALAVDEAFQRKVAAVAADTLEPGGGPCRHHKGPPKTYRRMAAKLQDPAGHRYEICRPRPALNADVIRCRVVTPDPAQLGPFLSRLSDAFSGFVGVQSDLLSVGEDPATGYVLPAVTVNVLFEDPRPLPQVWGNPQTRQRWAEHTWPGRAHLDGQSESRRAAHVQRARRWLETQWPAEWPARMIGEVQVMTPSAHERLVRSEELRRILQCGTPKALFHEYNRDKPPPPRDLFRAAELGEGYSVQAHLEAQRVNAVRPDGCSALDLAAAQGHPDVVDLLIRRHAHIQHREAPQPALVMAAANGHLDVVRILLRGRADPNGAGRNGTFPLVAAASSGYTDVVQVLLAAGADPRRPSPHRMVLRCLLSLARYRPLLRRLAGPHRKPPDPCARLTPLSAAAQNGTPEVVLALLTARANPNVRDGDGATPLLEAAARNHVAAVQALVNGRADPNPSPSLRSTPLCAAAASGYAELVAVLLQARAFPDRRDREGRFPLLCAAMEGHVPVVRRLIAAKADTDMARADGWTPLFAALACWRPDAAEALLDLGAGPSCSVASERSPLLLAVLKGYPAVVERLLAVGADPNAADVEGERPLAAAVVRGRHRVVQALLAVHANPNLGDGRGCTPLHHAALAGDLGAIARLLDAHADPHQGNDDGVSPPLLAAALRRTEVLEALLSRETNPDRGLFSANVLLLQAVGRGYADVVGSLLKVRADPHHRGPSGRSAVEMAQAGAPLPAVQILLGGLRTASFTEIALLHEKEEEEEPSAATGSAILLAL